MPNAVAYLDVEFSDFVHAELLSIGLVSTRGAEHYVELDLATDVGKARVANSSNFVRYDGVLDLWHQVPGATCSERDMGLRTAEWLLELAATSGTRVDVLYDYDLDYELMEYLIRDACPGLWDRVREIVAPMNIGMVSGSIEGQHAAEACYQSLRQERGLSRHHALADACALRSAHLAVTRQC